MPESNFTDWLSAIAAWAAVAVSAGAAIFTWLEWRKINRKIAMLDDAGAAAEVLPTWYTSRMMMDHWLFGLLTADGRVIAITRIRSISDDGEWMDVELATSDDLGGLDANFKPAITAVAEDRTRASVKISNIVAAMELQTS